MQFTYYCIFAFISAVSGRTITFNDTTMPILLVTTSYGQFDHERIDYLEAEIHPRHVNTAGRINFPTSGYLNDYYTEARAPGDERGHLVASQFSGPAEWYNLSPQNARVNRNALYQSLTTDWYGTECEVRRFLDQGGDRYVTWRVNMVYNLNSNRPDVYHLQVEYFVNGLNINTGVNTFLTNPFLGNDSTFWICRGCGSNHHATTPPPRTPRPALPRPPTTPAPYDPGYYDDELLSRRRRSVDDQCVRK